MVATPALAAVGDLTGRSIRSALLALGELCAVPWKVVVTRDGEDVAEEKVEGWPPRDHRHRIFARTPGRCVADIRAPLAR